MEYSDRDIIVAPATAYQVRAPLAIIRLSGFGCIDMVSLCFRSAGSRTQNPWELRYGDWCDEDGLVDDVMLVCYRAPRSYTGQDMVEIFCHGNPLFIDDIIRSLLSRGARRARPGEFTMRAVINGKMDLLRAEGVHDLIEANTRYQADLIRRQSGGPLVDFVKESVEEILQIQAHIEATIDYGEEDIDALERDVMTGRLQNLCIRFERLDETAGFTKSMRRGFRVLITGAPNVGKSTLFNTLVKQERAIVTHLPGTTRDLISEEIEIGGLPIVLIDSAGVRDTRDEIEEIGIAKIFELLHDVDLVLYLSESDEDEPPYEQLKELPKEKWVAVKTKSDLKPVQTCGRMIISARTGEGLERLEQEVVLRLSTAMKGQPVYLINQRQEELISDVLRQLQTALDEYRAGFGEEVVSSYLNSVRGLLGELTGETGVEDILDRMFANFCLGK
ncbi:MAG: tRNA uridine-5-carboxymethylaminomethyl(34) synthesis GTPase MnmE [Acidobacteriota bacterium]|nr:tRNA uridine-5-carboxymethylaminomethyl(34) synthesis GTPase MnmE [Acidobacteriota bacterium]